MALLNPSAIFQLGDAYFFHAATGTARPTDLGTFDTFEDFETAGWTSYGATKLDSLATVNREGGEAEATGVWQLPSYFSKTSAVVESLDFDLSEFTVESMRRYLGGNASVDSDSAAGAQNPVGVREAFLLAIKVADGFIGIYVDEAEVLGRENVEFGERGSIPSLPVKVTAKSSTGYGFRWFGLKSAA